MMENEEIYKFEHAGAMAGEYLESIGKTDLAALSREEWLQLLYIVVKGFHEAPPF